MRPNERRSFVRPQYALRTKKCLGYWTERERERVIVRPRKRTRKRTKRCRRSSRKKKRGKRRKREGGVERAR